MNSKVMEQLTDVLKGWTIDEVTWGDSETFRLYVHKGTDYQMVQIVATDLGMNLDRIDVMNEGRIVISQDLTNVIEKIALHWWCNDNEYKNEDGEYNKQYDITITDDGDNGYLISCDRCGELWEITEKTIERNENMDNIRQFVPEDIKDTYKELDIRDLLIRLCED